MKYSNYNLHFRRFLMFLYTIFDLVVFRLLCKIGFLARVSERHNTRIASFVKW